MNIEYKNLAAEQRTAAIQRLTALWAFSESGLGGILHVLQIPFTGLIVGGMAVIIISFIAEISAHNYRQILKSAVIVLIVKAMVSPYTPFPAYIAVSFQSLLGYLLFSFLRVNFFSILLLSMLAMVESAIQKLLILTFFFGQSFWKATGSMVEFVAGQFGVSTNRGSEWIIGTYLLTYMIGGIFIAWIAYKIIKGFSEEKGAFGFDNAVTFNTEIFRQVTTKRKTLYTKLWILVITLAAVSIILFLLAEDTGQGWLLVLKTVSWTVSVVLGWYMIIRPLFTKFIQKLLQKKESRYSDEVLKILSFLPVLRQLTALAWQKSRLYDGWKRWQFFFSAFIHWSLTYSETPAPGVSLNPSHEHHPILKTDT